MSILDEDGQGVRVTTIQTTVRRRPDEVLGIEGGASRRGSTYWRRAIECPREHLLANELGWEPAALGDPLTFGLIWHYCLEAYYRVIQEHQNVFPAFESTKDYFWGANEEAEIAAYQALVPFAGEPGYEKCFEKISQMLDVYFERYRREDKWQIVGVEVELASEMRHGFEYTTRLDLMVVDHASEPALKIIEHKSSYRLDRNVLEGYTQDFQTIGQVWLVEAELDLEKYPPFVGSVINIVSKESTPKCARSYCQPSKYVLASWQRSMQALSVQADYFEALDYPQNFASCSRKFGRCQFFELCRTFPDLGVGDLKGMGDPILGLRRKGAA